MVAAPARLCQSLPRHFAWDAWTDCMRANGYKGQQSIPLVLRAMLTVKTSSGISAVPWVHGGATRQGS